MHYGNILRIASPQDVFVEPAYSIMSDITGHTVYPINIDSVNVPLAQRL